MENQKIRRSDRVDLVVNIEIEGFEADGQPFWERTRTLRISKHGASICVSRKLAPNDELALTNLDNNRKADVRVVGKIGELMGEFIYGLAFIRPEEGVWDIEFPPLTEAQNAASRILLECSACRSREVLHLDEIETEVFQAERALHRYCKKCSDSTVWKDANQSPAKAEPVTQVFERPRQVAPPPPPPETKEKRSHPRIKVRMTICVRKAGQNDDIAEASDVSRGGLCFDSACKYERGERLEIATHYDPNAPAIFIPARIAHVRERKDSGKTLYRYGACYLDAKQAQFIR
jgi:hypothetical protein